MNEIIEIKNPNSVGPLKIILMTVLGIFIFVTAIISLVGVYIIGDTGNILSGLPILLTGLGIFFFLLLGFLSLKWNERYEILSTSFDTVNQKFFVKQRNGDEGFISFQELLEFKERTHIVRGKSSSTTYYIVSVLKKDGALWDLTYFTNEQESRNFIENLKSKIDFSKEGFSQPEENKERRHKVIEDSFQTKIHWVGEIPLYQKVFTILGLLGFLTTFINFFNMGGDFNSVQGYIVIGFITIFFGFIFYSIFKTYFDFKEFELIIDSNQLKLLGIKKTNRKELGSMPILEIQSTKFPFSLFESARDIGILILNKETETLFEKIQNGPKDFSSVLDLVKDALKFKKTVLKLTFLNYTPVEILEFEKDLDKSLQRYNEKIN